MASRCAFGSRPRSRLSTAAGLLSFLAGVLAALAPGLAAEPPGPNQVTLYAGPGLSGPSQSWSLADDKPFLAVPVVDDELGGGGAVAVGSEVGVILLSEPFFSATDSTCDYQLGTSRRPDFWWLSENVRVAPGPDDVGAIDAGLGGRPVASLIVYRRALGPPPAVQLLEKRRYVNWECVRATKARGYRRLFVPVAAAPYAVGCFDLEVDLYQQDVRQASLEFTAASLALLMLPRDLGDRYQDIAHELTVALYDAPDCEGESVAFAHPGSAGRLFDLEPFGLDRKARSVLIRYDGGAYDDYLLPPDQQPTVAVQEIVQAPPPPAAPEPTALATSGGLMGVDTSVEPVESAALPETGQAQSAGATAEPATATHSAASGTAWGTSQAEAAAIQTLSEGGAQQTPAQGAAEAPAQSTVGLQSGQEASEPPPETQAGFLMLPEGEGAPEGSQTYDFPLLQGYRLHACLAGNKDCGEPAASAWCKARGFASVVAWKIDENIGSLFPTLAIGDLQLCANYVCDGFKEITCGS